MPSTPKTPTPWRLFGAGEIVGPSLLLPVMSKFQEVNWPEGWPFDSPEKLRQDIDREELDLQKTFKAEAGNKTRAELDAFADNQAARVFAEAFRRLMLFGLFAP